MFQIIGLVILFGVAWHLSGKPEKKKIIPNPYFSEEEIYEGFQEVYRIVYEKEPPIYLNSEDLKFRIKTKVN